MMKTRKMLSPESHISTKAVHQVYPEVVHLNWLLQDNPAGKSRIDGNLVRNKQSTLSDGDQWLISHRSRPGHRLRRLLKKHLLVTTGTGAAPLLGKGLINHPFSRIASSFARSRPIPLRPPCGAHDDPWSSVDWDITPRRKIDTTEMPTIVS